MLECVELGLGFGLGLKATSSIGRRAVDQSRREERRCNEEAQWKGSRRWTIWGKYGSFWCVEREPSACFGAWELEVAWCWDSSGFGPSSVTGGVLSWWDECSCAAAVRVSDARWDVLALLCDMSLVVRPLYSSLKGRASAAGSVRCTLGSLILRSLIFTSIPAPIS